MKKKASGKLIQVVTILYQELGLLFFNDCFTLEACFTGAFDLMLLPGWE